MNENALRVDGWHFCSPVAAAPREWRERLCGPAPDVAATAIPSDLIPSKHRRRMSRLSKMSVQAALAAADGQRADYLVFCSRHGELNRTRTLLASIACGSELSPAEFSQSVHNTSSGLYSIIARSRAPACSLASGAATFAYGWLEAEGYLAEHPGGRVLLVDSDDALPEEYAALVGEAIHPYAMALLVSADREGLSLRVDCAAGWAEEPLGPQFLDWWLSSASGLSVVAEGQRFTWTRPVEP